MSLIELSDLENFIIIKFYNFFKLIIIKFYNFIIIWSKNKLLIQITYYYKYIFNDWINI